MPPKRKDPAVRAFYNTAPVDVLHGEYLRDLEWPSVVDWQNPKKINLNDRVKELECCVQYLKNKIQKLEERLEEETQDINDRVNECVHQTDFEELKEKVEEL